MHLVVCCSNCMQQILESVDYCHQMSIVHRDLKVSQFLTSVSDGTHMHLSLSLSLSLF